MTSRKAYALRYAQNGIPVFPVHYPTRDQNQPCSCKNTNCGQIGKHPVPKNGFKDATTDHDKVSRWWDSDPNWNIGMPTGHVSGLIVIDVDDIEALRGIGEFPVTLQASSGRGIHAYYKAPERRIPNSESKIAPKVDVRGDGGYILLPPSLHKSGNLYKWKDKDFIDGVATELAEDQVRRLVGSKSSGRGRTQHDTGGTVFEGQRNSELTRIAGAMRRHGCGKETIFAALLEENKTRCKPPIEDESELESIAEGMLRYDPERAGFTWTDTGNAERLVAFHGGDLRYCHEMSSWLVYDGRRWIEDRTEEVNRRATATVKAMYAEAESIDDQQERKKFIKWVTQSESDNRIRAMIGRARSIAEVSVSICDLDSDMWAVNVENGTLDLKTGELRPHDRADLITKLAPVEWRGLNEPAPIWDAFQSQITVGQSDLVAFKRRLFGYSMTGDVSEQKLAVAFGSGANGKSTESEALLEMMGDYGQQASTDLLIASKSNAGGATPEIADLRGARFVVCSEIEQGARLAESLVKQLTGGDRIKARRLFQQGFEFKPTHKILMATNHKPQIRGTDYGIWRRLMLIPYEVTIPETEQDKNLPEKLRDEMPGILAWAVRGCLEWQDDGLNPPPQITAATSEYRREMNPLADFFEDRCEFAPGFWTTSADLWSDFEDWTITNGRESVGRSEFNERLRSNGCEAASKKKNGTKQRGWKGIKLQLEATSTENKDTYNMPDPDELDLTA